MNADATVLDRDQSSDVREVGKEASTSDAVHGTPSAARRSREGRQETRPAKADVDRSRQRLTSNCVSCVALLKLTAEMLPNCVLAARNVWRRGSEAALAITSSVTAKHPELRMSAEDQEREREREKKKEKHQSNPPTTAVAVARVEMLTLPRIAIANPFISTIPIGPTPAVTATDVALFKLVNRTSDSAPKLEFT